MALSHENIAAVAIGAVVSYTLSNMFERVIKRGEKSSQCNAKVTTLTTSRLPPVQGPYTRGKTISCSGAGITFAAGNIGMHPETK